LAERADDGAAELSGAAGHDDAHATSLHRSDTDSALTAPSHTDALCWGYLQRVVYPHMAGWEVDNQLGTLSLTPKPSVRFGRRSPAPAPWTSHGATRHFPGSFANPAS